MKKRLGEGLWTLNFWIPNDSVNLVAWEKRFSPPNAISWLEKLGWWCRWWGKEMERGPKGLINCYLKKSRKLTCKRLCRMGSVVTKVHIVPSNSNKMKCLYHNKKLQPTLLTKTIISQNYCFFLSLQSTRFPQSHQQRETATKHGYLYVCVLWFSFWCLR